MRPLVSKSSSPFKSTDLRSFICVPEAEKEFASASIEPQMAPSQDLRYRSSPGQSRSTGALGRPSRIGRSGSIERHPQHHSLKIKSFFYFLIHQEGPATNSERRLGYWAFQTLVDLHNLTLIIG
jgi:hypothetical protein